MEKPFQRRSAPRKIRDSLPNKHPTIAQSRTEAASREINLTHWLWQIGEREENLRLPNTRADETRFNSAPDPRIPCTRDIQDPHICRLGRASL